MNDGTALPPRALDYLRQLDLEAASLPPAERVRLVGQIREHLLDALADGADAGDAVARVGHPRELVAEAAPELPVNLAGPSWQRVVLGCSIVAAVMSVAGMVGTLVAIASSQRGLLLIPSMLLLALGSSALLATGVVGLLLRGADRATNGLHREALRARPLLAARLVTGWAMLALGTLGCALSGLMLAVTGNPGSALILVLGLAAAAAGVVLLVSTARVLRSHAAPAAVG